VRYIGATTHPAWQVMEALMVSQLRRFARFISEQPPYNLLDRRIENELVPLCLKYGLGLIPWAPLASGVLAGRYTEGVGIPTDSRAALRGGIYAERVTPRGVAAGTRFVELAHCLWHDAGAVWPVVGEGAARHHRAALWPAHGGAA
jgi:aryl-alcohol dehydrogenase-like predicted oxidoreductase